MKFALFLGCKIPYFLQEYGTATRAVLEALNIECVDIEFNCCGYPTRALDTEAYLFSAARNYALAAARGLDILTPCKCCFGSLRHARYWLDNDPAAKEKITRRLTLEGLVWPDETRAKHLLSVLANDVGVAAIAAKVKYPFKNLNIAAHYGCHALRPSNITQFDDPLDPTLFEKLIHVTGASGVAWDQRLACCGNPLWEKNTALSLEFMDRKLNDARQSGADVLCTACTYCQIQFDTVQHEHRSRIGAVTPLASILYPQLLGLSMGLDPNAMQLTHNKLDITGVQSHLADAGDQPPGAAMGQAKQDNAKERTHAK